MMLTENRQSTILIVDDNITNLKVAMEYLKAYSFNILFARDGESGIERAQLAQPHLILLDVQMPNIDGFETCRRLKANPATSKIPVILMTVLSESSYKVRGLEVGAVDYITKPIEEKELLARVNIHLRLRNLQEQLEERVRERTAALEEEVLRRTRYQEENEGLLELVRQQSEQLRQLTQLLLDDQAQHQGKLQNSHQQIDRDLLVLQTQLSHAQQLLSDRPGHPQTPALTLEAIRNALDVLSHAHQQSQQISTELEQASSVQVSLRDNPLLKLSDREYEVLQLLAQGKSNGEIAEMLHVAKTTVSTHQRRIMEKLDVESSAELVRFALLRANG